MSCQSQRIGVCAESIERIDAMPNPITNLTESMRDVKRLMQIHSDVGGTTQGRRYGLDVLNRSGVVFLAAAWEAFVEDVALQAINHILSVAKNPKAIPLSIRKGVARYVQDSKHDLKAWDLAGEGWKEVVREYKDDLLRQDIATFNTPKPHNVDNLFKKLLGVEQISALWCWQGMSKTSASAKLRKFIETRGAIAHRGELLQSITKDYVEDHRKFINRLCVKTSNVIRDHIKTQVGSYPWRCATYGSFR